MDLKSLSHNNPGALRVLTELMFKYPDHLSYFEDNNIKGSDIWKLYKDCCHSSIDNLVFCIENFSYENIRNHIDSGESYSRDVQKADIRARIYCNINDHINDNNLNGIVQSFYVRRDKDLICVQVNLRNHRGRNQYYSLVSIESMDFKVFIEMVLHSIDEFINDEFFGKGAIHVGNQRVIL